MKGMGISEAYAVQKTRFWVQHVNDFSRMGDRSAKLFPVCRCGMSWDCNINWLYFNLIMNDPRETVQKLLFVRFVTQTPEYWMLYFWNR